MPSTDNCEPKKRFELGPLSFDEAIVSFEGYPDPSVIPRILYRRIKAVIDRERIPMDQACEDIARVAKVSREEVRAKLLACEAPQGGVIKVRMGQRLDRIPKSSAE